MVFIRNASQPIGARYSSATGRLKQVIVETSEVPTKKVALLGDSTLDNGYWVQKKTPYDKKTHTVTHQTAVALANNAKSCSYEIGNFAVDGATTNDLMHYCYLNKVLPTDTDHTDNIVHQLDAVKEWRPDVAVLSVGGNNYREALLGTLMSQLSYLQLLLRITPKDAKPEIKKVFTRVKATLLEEYKQIIDKLVEENPQLSRIVLLSQYYPSITEFTPYVIYTGFSHVARAEGKGQDPFTAVQDTMEELYRELMTYVATKGKEVVFADVTSSMNPLGGKHTMQIEPNERGSTIMGRLIAKAVEYTFPEIDSSSDEKPIALLRMSRDEQSIQSQLLSKNDITHFKVKTIAEFIRENRYRHVSLFFSPSSSLGCRYESAYHLIMGKQFDSEYRGLFAFGLLDASLVTVMASYLWRAAVNENLHASLRVAAGAVAAPILLGKTIVGLSLMLALALPVLGYHQVASHFSKMDETQIQFSQESTSSEVDSTDKTTMFL
ncbi:Uncharacterised protein [Legionella lansingensis]|uniref:Uncharacterized protein n=1 Tax=Legionella lansingensis TaxID=45067 RepID=A0A0W0VTG8_9GAMM|nr:SGNH/GDSL hydrolase family protein [Legionella lansingensis]KTD23447.1 hypothetical protein Llan_0818 [Legionella lansingensis]SNV50878.1 Uncharacterised protein [Legionella lansingensis]